MSKTTVDEDLRLLRSSLRAAEQEISELRERNEHLEKDLRLAKRKLEDSWEQLETLRHSTSWRLTAPLRGVKAALRRGLVR